MQRRGCRGEVTEERMQRRGYRGEDAEEVVEERLQRRGEAAEERRGCRGEDAEERGEDAEERMTRRGCTGEKSVPGLLWKAFCAVLTALSAACRRLCLPMWSCDMARQSKASCKKQHSYDATWQSTAMCLQHATLV